VNINKRLAAQFAGVMAIAMVFGTSAFAETRHHDETNRSGDRQERHHRDNNNNNDANRSTVQPDQFRGSNRTNETRTYDHNRNNNYNRGNESRTYDRSRENNRSYDNRTYNNRTYDNRGYSHNSSEWRGGNRDYRNNNNYRGNDYGHRGNPYYTHGRINRIERWNGGYRIFLGGALYPFFVPEARFRLGNWRVGLDIRLGGYYNPLGYYDYYDDAYYDGAYYGGAAVSSGALRGVVETVDYRRDTFVLRDDISGNFVTVVMRGGDRRFDTLRPGDYIDVAGDWSRNGLFEAYRADLLEGGNYRR